MTQAANPNPPALPDPLQQILVELNACARDIELSIIVSHDGLTMVSLGPVSDAERAGAMCADLLSLCRATARELQRGELLQVVIRGKDGCMFLAPAGPKAVLAVMARPDANLGMVLAEAQRAAETIAGAL